MVHSSAALTKDRYPGLKILVNVTQAICSKVRRNDSLHMCQLMRSLNPNHQYEPVHLVQIQIEMRSAFE
jgi:hypothetical protein